MAQKSSNQDEELGPFLIGLVIGGLVGIAAALWYAPQSGKTTRTEIKQRSEDVIQAAEQTVVDVRHKIEGESIDESLETGKAEALRHRQNAG